MSTWNIALLQDAPLAGSRQPRNYDQERDCITTLLVDICDELAESGNVRFVVSGFGQSEWPVDVRTDLPVVVEQVPSVLTALRAGKSTSLGFYEQGVLRVLAIELTGGTEVTITCQSMTSWEPCPSAVSMKKSDLVALLASLLQAFVDCARQVSPDVVGHVWFREWLQAAQRS